VFGSGGPPAAPVFRRQRVRSVLSSDPAPTAPAKRSPDASSFKLGHHPDAFDVALRPGCLLGKVVRHSQHLAGLHQQLIVGDPVRELVSRRSLLGGRHSCPQSA
jgi:hypothetical protein